MIAIPEILSQEVDYHTVDKTLLRERAKTNDVSREHDPGGPTALKTEHLPAEAIT